MDEARLRALFDQVATGELSPADATRQLRHFSLQDLGAIQLDTHRELRRGFPEVIYAPGKSLAQLQQIVEAHEAARRPLVITRLAPEPALALCLAHPTLAYSETARIATAHLGEIAPLGVRVLVICAGTSDLPVAHEAALIARLSGCEVATIPDCGVAGIHRLTARIDDLESADLLIVVAGMEGALPSVIAGLTSTPMIAVPTSIGYGTGLGGYAALLTMLNSCAAGTVVVNIDNGFGAGYFAGLLARQMARRAAAGE